MQKNLKCEAGESGFAKQYKPKIVSMDYEGILISERMKEIMGMCERNNPIYEQVSSYSVAFYTLGFFECRDFMAFQDISADQAVDILKSEFSEIKFDEIPKNYQITNSKDQYLLVIGDPIFPEHFAVIVDMNSSRPYFSKLPFFGAGCDSMDELVKEFAGYENITANDFHFFRKERWGQIPPESRGKIYIIKD